MQHFRQFSPRTLSFRFLLIFFFAAIVPFLTISMITLSRVSDALEQEAQERITQMIHLAGSNLDSRMDALTSITEKMYVYSTNEYGAVNTLEDILRKLHRLVDRLHIEVTHAGRKARESEKRSCYVRYSFDFHFTGPP